MYSIKNISYEYLSQNNNRYSLVEKLAKLHYENLPKSKYTMIGIDAVKTLYLSLLTSKKINLFIAKKDNSEIIGFIISSQSKLSIAGLIFKNLFRNKYIKLKFLLQLIYFKNIKNIIIEIFNPSKDFLFEKNIKYSQILSLIVNKPEQGKGIAKRLIKLLFSISKSNECKKIISITTSYQKNAIFFYESIEEFKLVKKFKIGSNSFKLVYEANVL